MCGWGACTDPEGAGGGQEVRTPPPPEKSQKYRVDDDTHNSIKETPISYSSAKQGEYSVGKQAANSIPVVISENLPKHSDSRRNGLSTRDGYYNSELRAPDEGDGDFETFIR